MRSEKQIVDERKDRGESGKVLIERVDNPLYWLNLGAWLALVWALESDDQKYPLVSRLKNAEGNTFSAKAQLASAQPTVLDAPNLPQSKSRNPPFEKQAK